MNKKSHARNRAIVQTPTSHYIKIRSKKFHTAKPLTFSLHMLFRREQINHFNLTSEIETKTDTDKIAGKFPENSRRSPAWRIFGLKQKKETTKDRKR